VKMTVIRSVRDVISLVDVLLPSSMKKILGQIQVIHIDIS